jgi:DNA invertase Pin-like site-specific DNA recombinase
MVAHFENRKRAEIMTQARKAKAKQGMAVSRLPVGWIKGPDGKYDYDPETKETIKMVIETFWQTRSIRRTVKVLAKGEVRRVLSGVEKRQILELSNRGQTPAA